MSQVWSANRAGAVVSKVCVVNVACPRLSVWHTPATTLRLCKSRPTQCGYSTSIGDSILSAPVLGGASHRVPWAGDGIIRFCLTCSSDGGDTHRSPRHTPQTVPRIRNRTENSVGGQGAAVSIDRSRSQRNPIFMLAGAGRSAACGTVPKITVVEMPGMVLHGKHPGRMSGSAAS